MYASVNWAIIGSNHYLNQCWLIAIEILWLSLEYHKLMTLKSIMQMAVHLQSYALDGSLNVLEFNSQETNQLSSYYTPSNEVGEGYTGFTLSVRPSVRPSVRLSTTWFPEHKSSLLWNFNFKFHMHVDGGHRQKPIDFQRCHFQNGRLAAILDYLVSRLELYIDFEYQLQTSATQYLCIWVGAY